MIPLRPTAPGVPGMPSVHSPATPGRPGKPSAPLLPEDRQKQQSDCVCGGVWVCVCVSTHLCLPVDHLFLVGQAIYQAQADQSLQSAPENHPPLGGLVYLAALGALV